MSKDQNPSDKACDAYFDNPCAATSGSYYSDRVTFYAGFAAGAASRDAEVVSLTNQRDYEYVRAENAEQERDQLRETLKDHGEIQASLCNELDQLRAQIKMLREALEYCITQVGELATVPGIASALASTPEQSLAEHDRLLVKIAAKDAEIAELVGVLGDVTAHLAAAHSLLSRGGKKAAASDTIFKIMLQDYEKSFEAGRKMVAAKVRKP